MSAADLTDAELWAEVERRELATIVGYVNPDQVSREDPADEGSLFIGHVLFRRTWVNRWPLYGLRAGASIDDPLAAGEPAAPPEPEPCRYCTGMTMLGRCPVCAAPPATPDETTRLDVMPDLIAAVKDGRARVVSQKPYVVNGKTMYETEIEWSDAPPVAAPEAPTPETRDDG